MIRIIHEIDDPTLMEQVWSFRHQRFVVERGWTELRRPDLRERDEFDTNHAYHAVLIDGRDVVGYSRLLPTTLPHLTQEFAGRQGTTTPAGPSVFEWSRCAVAPGPRKIDGKLPSDILMTGVLECLIELEATSVVFLTYNNVIKMMRRRGYPVVTLCSVALQNGDSVNAAASLLTKELLLQHRQRHDISGSILDWGRATDAKRLKPPAAA